MGHFGNEGWRDFFFFFAFFMSGMALSALIVCRKFIYGLAVPHSVLVWSVSAVPAQVNWTFQADWRH